MEEVKVYKTIDGQVFDTYEQAKEHEESIANIKVFCVQHQPDLNETGMLQKESYLIVHANGQHQLFAEHWCHENIGNALAFVMGVYGSNAIVRNWRLREVKKSYLEIKNEDILAKIEENFVTHIFDKEHK
ncbi:hypothetical protein [Bacillus sp. NPDC094106]|uniref:hypothetical protein n=1 Tax=Bacillus sp. NPDC094106 TaxID=3363949 RepID=UPI0038172DA7